MAKVITANSKKEYIKGIKPKASCKRPLVAIVAGESLYNKPEIIALVKQIKDTRYFFNIKNFLFINQ